MGTGDLPGGKCGGNVLLTIHPFYFRGLGKRGAIPPLPQCARIGTKPLPFLCERNNDASHNSEDVVASVATYSLSYPSIINIYRRGQSTETKDSLLPDGPLCTCTAAQRNKTDSQSLLTTNNHYQYQSLPFSHYQTIINNHLAK
jgi:hypothetical protein